MGRWILLLAFVLTLTVAGASHGTMITLYDGARGFDNPAVALPTSQGWTIVLWDGWWAQAWSGGITTMDTTPFGPNYRITYSANWRNSSQTVRHPLLPATLDRNPGYDTRFTMQLTSESHGSNDESGYSAIAMSSDNQGIELGFWNDRVWAYGMSGTQRVHAETTSGFSPSAALTTYDLTIRGDSYSLRADGAQILTGPLRNYKADTGLNRYGYCNFPNNIEFGDDSYNGSSVSQISFIGVDPFSWKAGDANGDYKVDGTDLAIWQTHYDPLGVNSNTFAMGDWNGDGKIDGADLALWQQNYSPLGYSTSFEPLSLDGSLGAVPEPATLTLLATGFAGLSGLLRSGRRCRRARE